jgi:hypothetical protein
MENLEVIPIPLLLMEKCLIIAEVDGRVSVNTGFTSYNNYRALLNTGYSIGINNSGYAL